MYVIVVVAEREEMLKFVDHFMSTTQNRRKSLQLLYIGLSEAVTLFD